MDYFLVSVFGALTGFAELIGRYRDAPFAAVTRFPGFLYLLLNALAGAAGLGLIVALDVTFGIDPKDQPDRLRWARVLAAGFSAMLVFRSSIFTVRAGDRDIPIGPAVVLQAVLNSLDRAIDRAQARSRDRFVAGLPADLPDTANRLRFLGAYCLGLMQNVPAEEQQAQREQIEKVINDKQNTPRDRLRLICLQLLTMIGQDVLKTALEQLRTPDEPVPTVPVIAQPPAEH